MLYVVSQDHYHSCGYESFVTEITIIAHAPVLKQLLIEDFIERGILSFRLRAGLVLIRSYYYSKWQEVFGCQSASFNILMI